MRIFPDFTNPAGIVFADIFFQPFEAFCLSTDIETLFQILFVHAQFLQGRDVVFSSGQVLLVLGLDGGWEGSGERDRLGGRAQGSGQLEVTLVS